MRRREECAPTRSATIFCMYLVHFSTSFLGPLSWTISLLCAGSGKLMITCKKQSVRVTPSARTAMSDTNKAWGDPVHPLFHSEKGSHVSSLWSREFSHSIQCRATLFMILATRLLSMQQVPPRIPYPLESLTSGNFSRISRIRSPFCPMMVRWNFCSMIRSLVRSFS